MANPPAAPRRGAPAPASNVDEVFDELPPDDGGTNPGVQFESLEPEPGSTTDQFGDEPGGDTDEGPPPEGATVVSMAPPGLQDPQPGGDGSTVIFDTNKGAARGAAAAIPPKLVVSKGQKPGTEYPLTGGPEWMIGRGDNCQVIVPDISVSRRHLLLRKRGARIIAVDQGSGNGTLVNGAQITEQELKSGDEIEVGDTVLKFVEPGAIVVNSGKRASPNTSVRPSPRGPPPGRTDVEATGRVAKPPRPSAAARSSGFGPSAATAAQSKGPNKLLLVVGGLFAVLCVGGIGVKIALDRAQPPAPLTPSGPTPQEISAKSLQEGIGLVKELKWDASRGKFEAALAADPGNEEAKRYLDRATKEMGDERALAEGQECLGKGDLKCAKDSLAKMNRESLTWVERGQGFQTDFDKGKAKQLDELTAKVEPLAALKKPDPAKAEEAKALEEAVGVLLAIFPEDPPLVALDEKVKKAHDFLAKRPVRVKPKEVPEGEVAVNGARAAYQAGRISEAIEVARSNDSDEAKAYLKNLQQFQRAYDSGMELEGGGAVKPLEAALKLDRALGGAPRLVKAAGDKLAKIYYASGMEAKASDNLERAFNNFQKALAADPGHGPAAKEMEALKGRAKDIFMEGYVLKATDPDSAKRKFKIVVKITPASSEWHDKASRWINQLDGKGE